MIYNSHAKHALRVDSNYNFIPLLHFMTYVKRPLVILTSCLHYPSQELYVPPYEPTGFLTPLLPNSCYH